MNAEKAHRTAEAEEQRHPVDLSKEPATPDPARLSGVKQDRLVHQKFGLIGYAPYGW